MSHNYVLDMYRFIDMRLETAREQLRAASPDAPERQFYEGRSDALNDVKSFLSEHFDHKLPRRIYRQLHREQADAPSRGK